MGTCFSGFGRKSTTAEDRVPRDAHTKGNQGTSSTGQTPALPRTIITTAATQNQAQLPLQSMSSMRPRNGASAALLRSYGNGGAMRKGTSIFSHHSAGAYSAMSGGTQDTRHSRRSQASHKSGASRLSLTFNMPSFSTKLIRSALAAVNAASDAFPPLKSATGGALWIIDEISKYQSYKSEWGDFARYVEFHIAQIIFVAKEHGVISPKLRESLDEVDKVLKNIQSDFNKISTLSSGSALLTYLQDRDALERYKASFDQALKKFNFQSTIQGHEALLHVLQDTQALTTWASSIENTSRLLLNGQKDILSHVEATEISSLLQVLQNHTVDGATGRGTGICLDGTRHAILDEIITFLQNQKSEPRLPVRIFLLAGVAGAGKSTIARTCLQHFNSRKEFHVASFFFSRAHPGRNTPAKAILHLAAALADAHQVVRNAMALALKEHQGLTSRDLVTQFSELICKPLSLLPKDSKSIVIVIDALDEAEDHSPSFPTRLPLEEHLFNEFLGVISKEWRLLPLCVRVLITMRDDREIMSHFTGKSHVHVHHLHMDNATHEDVRLYSRAKFNVIANKHEINGWPSIKQLETFTQKSGALFIWARMALDWIDEADDPVDELEQLLSSQPPPEAADRINNMYAMIIARLPWGHPSFHQRYRDILGAVLFVRRPLPLNSLASLLGKKEDALRRTLKILAPILTGINQEGQPVTVTHESVRDYLTIYAAQRSEERKFGISPNHVHDLLAQRCFSVIDKIISDEWVHAYDTVLQRQQTIRTGGQLLGRSLTRTEDHLIYAIDYWHEHTALGSFVAKSLQGRQYDRFIGKWKASFFFKTANLRRGRFATELLKAQLDAGFLFVGESDPGHPLHPLRLHLKALIDRVDRLGPWVEYEDPKVAGAARLQQLSLVLAGISLLYQSQRAQPIPAERITG
ncbi:hypothetical protein DL93DRAFT_2157747 [Clavulina sp. PMI_390]|nr:hypothetical protein DL93DRAFT_2157747 [Clavulina sp. PMI_390]